MENTTELIQCINALTLELQTLNNRVTLPEKQPLYTNKTLLDLLQINQRTLKRYRDEGYIGFSKVGDKFYYTADDVKKFLSKNHNEPFAYC